MKKNTLYKLIPALTALLFSNCSYSNQDNPALYPFDKNVAANTKAKVLKNVTVGTAPYYIANAEGFIYISNTGDGTISVIDSKTDTTVKTIKLEDGAPGSIEAFYDWKNILVTDTKKEKLLVIDPLQDHKILQEIPLGKNPDKIRISDDNKNVVVSLTGENKVIVLTFSEDRSKMPEKKEYNTGNIPGETLHRAVSTATGWAAVPNIADNDVSLFNLNTGTEKRLKEGNTPSVIDFGFKNNKAINLIVGNASSNNITLFDLTSDYKISISDVGKGPADIAVYPSLFQAFITMSESNEVAVIDYVGAIVLKRIPVGKKPVDIYSPGPITGLEVKHVINDNTEIWVNNEGDGSITILNPSTFEVKSTIKIGKGRHKMAFTGNKAYISNVDDNTVTIISRQ